MLLSYESVVVLFNFFRGVGVQIHINKSCYKFDLTCLEGLINEEAEKRAQSPRVTGGYFLFYKFMSGPRKLL